MLKVGLHSTRPMTRNLDTTICLTHLVINLKHRRMRTTFETQKNEDQKGALESIYNLIQPY